MMHKNCGRDYYIYKGSDLLVLISEGLLTSSNFINGEGTFAIYVYTDNPAAATASTKLVDIDGNLFAVVDSAKLQQLNAGALKYRMELGLKNDAFDDGFYNCSRRGDFGFYLKD